MFFPYRDENPRVLIPYVTYGILALNLVLFLFQISMGFKSVAGYEFTLSYGLIPATVSGTPHEIIVQTHEQFLSEIVRRPVHLNAKPHSPFVTLFTSMFMHGSIMHLLWNMWFLWIFADNVEGILGHFKFIIFYLICGLTAGIVQTVINLNSTIPIVGASGAIAGVLGAYMITFPRTRVHTLIFLFWYITIVRIPALYLLGFWFLIQITSGLGALRIDTTGGVAWFAHIGGFVAGVVLIRLQKMIKFERI